MDYTCQCGHKTNDSFRYCCMCGYQIQVSDHKNVVAHVTVCCCNIHPDKKCSMCGAEPFPVTMKSLCKMVLMRKMEIVDYENLLKRSRLRYDAFEKIVRDVGNRENLVWEETVIGQDGDWEPAVHEAIAKGKVWMM